MSRSAGLFLLLTAAVLMIGCAASGVRQRAAKSSGQIAFERHCRTCHRLPKPASYADHEWPALVARYGPRARLSSEQISAITDYLLAVNEAGTNR